MPPPGAATSPVPAAIIYGIHPAYQNKGYMTEAIRALVDWAFSHPFCRGITATTVINPASNRVLEKLRAQLLERRENETDWIILPATESDHD